MKESINFAKLPSLNYICGEIEVSYIFIGYFASMASKCVMTGSDVFPLF
jgi:hypothetical protein